MDLIELWPEDNATAAGIQVAAKPSRPPLPIPYLSINTVLEDQAAVEAPLLKDQAAVEAPLLEDQAVRIETPIKRRAKVTWPPSNSPSTQDNYDLGKVDLNSGGASGQVE